MNETPALPPPQPAEPAAPPPRSPAPRGRNLVPWVYAFGFIVLALALLWVWQNPRPAPLAMVSKRVDTIAQQLRALEAQVTQLAARPTPEPVDLAPLEQRLAALERRPPPAPDLAPVEQQIAALKAEIAALPPSGAPAPELGLLLHRMSAIEREVQETLTLKSQLDAVSGQLASQQAGLDPRLTQLAAEQQATAARIQAIDAALKAQQASVGTQLQAAQQQASAALAAAKTATRLARLEAARMALQAGMPLGTIDGAPPALSRFAAATPPTEAVLRLAFPAAAKAARDAATSDTAGQPLGERLWQRAQQLITVREGDRVLVGNPASGVLAQAQAKLDAGDLAGAVASVSALNGAAAQAMAGWLDQAKALLAARAALDAMAAHA